jgi:hypothetical protein
MLRAARVGVCLILLSGRAAGQQDPSVSLNAALTECKAISDAVQATRCVNRAEDQYLRPGFAYPDLLDLRQATHLSIATRLNKHEITPDEALLEAGRSDAQISAEFQRRENSESMVHAQARAVGPVTCTRMGTITTCD